MTLNILIVGTGLTGSLTAHTLQSKFPSWCISVWDKSRGAGGRMTTSRPRPESSCLADLGAQCVSTTLKKKNKYSYIYDSLFQNMLLAPLCSKVVGLREFSEPTEHYVAPLGMSSIVKHFLSAIPNVKYLHHINRIRNTEQNKIIISTESGVETMFDAVVFTIPVPQLLQLEGLLNKSNDIKEKLQSVVYSSRYALVLFFENSSFELPTWSCQYLDHDIIRYVSIDNIKRGRISDPVSVVFHTSVQFGCDHIDEEKSDIEVQLLKSVHDLFPDWPVPSSIKTHKWRYSQVVGPYPEQPGCVVLQTNPLIILGGDGFSNSNFDGCIYSSEKIVEALCKLSVP